MLFAHGPLGFLTSWITKPFWKKHRIKGKRLWIIWALGIVGGIFPDVDLIYYFWIDATLAHRAMITHTPFLYIIVFILGASLFWLIRKKQWIVFLGVFCIGAVFHTIADMIVSKVMLFYPFSHAFIGITLLNIEFISDNLRFVNFLVEGIICFLFFYVLIRMYAKKVVLRIVLTIILLSVFAGGVWFLIVWNNHAYHAPRDLHYADFDQDGIVNVYDLDIDGDQILNIDDLDSDGDGDANTYEIIKLSERFIDVWYDFSDGQLAQIPARFGFVSNNDLVELLFEAVGIHTTTEMREDYKNNPEGYVLEPQDANFGRNMKNIYTWLEHINRLEVGKQLETGRNQIGDILFFESGYISVVTGFNNAGQELLLDINSDRIAQELNYIDIVELEGEPTARGKILSAKALYRD